jgi:hypothetical protein
METGEREAEFASSYTHISSTLFICYPPIHSAYKLTCCGLHRPPWSRQLVHPRQAKPRLRRANDSGGRKRAGPPFSPASPQLLTPPCIVIPRHKLHSTSVKYHNCVLGLGLGTRKGKQMVTIARQLRRISHLVEQFWLSWESSARLGYPLVFLPPSCGRMMPLYRETGATSSNLNYATMKRMPTRG